MLHGTQGESRAIPCEPLLVYELDFVCFFAKESCPYGGHVEK